MKRKIKFLILEDVLTDLELVLMELEKAQLEFTYLHVETEKDFIKGLHEFKPDLILSDYRLPQFNGMQALKLNKEISPLIPFIIITGSINEDTAVECMKAGATDYVIKQNLIRLNSAIEQALDKKVLLEEKTKAEEALREKSYILNERVKELNCLYKISQLVETPGISDKHFFQGVVDLIPPAFQHSNITVCKLIINDKEFLTKNFTQTDWALHQDIVINNVKAGVIDVYHIKAIPETKDQQFLDEEKSLLNAVAEHLGRVAEHKTAEDSIFHLNKVLRAIRDVNQLIVKEKNMSALIKKSCDILTKTRGYDRACIVLFDEHDQPYKSSLAKNTPEYVLFEKAVKKGTWDGMCRKVMDQEGIVILDNPEEQCKGCPLQSLVPKSKAMSIRLEYEGKIFGFISGWIPERIPLNADEQDLFIEVAGDIGFALYTAELEKKRKEAIDSLAASEEMFRLLAANSIDCIWKINKKLQFTYLSPALERMTGFKPEEWVGTHLSTHFTKKEFLKVSALAVNALKNYKNFSHITFETKMLNKNKEEIDFEITSKLIKDKKGKIIGLQGTTRDISDRKKNEQTIKQNREMLVRTEAIAHIGSWEWEIATDTVIWSDELFRIFGIEIAKTAPSWKEHSALYYPEDMKKLTAAVEKAVTKGSTYEMELKAIRKDGETRICLARGIARKGKGGKITHLFGSLQDITESKEAEEKITKANRIYSVISQINQTIVHEKDKNLLFREACRIAVEFGKFQLAWIGIVDESTKLVVPVQYAGNGAGYFSTIPQISVEDIPEGRGPTGTAIREGKHVACNDIPNDPRMTPWREEALKRDYRSAIALPIKLYDKVIGAFNIYSNNPHFFDETEIALLDEITQDISFAISAIETENKRIKAEEALIKNEKKYRDIYENIQDVYYETDLKGNILEVSPSIKALSRGQYTREEVIGKNMNDFYSKPEERTELIQELLKHKRVSDYEITLKNKDDSRIICSLASILQFGNEGKPEKIIGSMHDITKRKHTEKGLHESEERLLLTLQSADLGSWYWDIPTGHVVFNERWAEMLGYKLSEIEPTLSTWEKLVHPDDLPGIMKGLNDHLKGNTPSYKAEFRMKTKSNEWKWILDSGKVIERDKQGKPLRAAGTHLDITERKLAEKTQKILFNISKALNVTENLQMLYKEIHAYLGEVLDTTNFYIALYDRENELLTFEYYADEKFDKDYLPSGRAFGKGLTEYVISTGNTILATLEKQDELAREGKIEIIGPRSKVWLSAPLKVENEVIGALAVQSYDDTDHYNEKDIQILDFVSSEVAIAIKRKQSEQQIQRDLKEKTLLLQEIHHRTKNNLQTICSLMQMQEDNILTKKDALQGFQVTQDRIRAMAKSYEILLRSEYMSEIKLGEYITELADQLGRNYDIHRKIKIIYSLEDVHFDAEKLSKLGLILNEIITNSIKYAFKGRDGGNIHIILKDAKNHITIEISDDGIGIPKNIKIPNPKTLGLSLVDMLMSELNGSYSVGRKNGTSFTLEIPKERKNH